MPHFLLNSKDMSFYYSRERYLFFSVFYMFMLLSVSVTSVSLFLIIGQVQGQRI